ncbi:MAG TPA: helix-turn-helix domain-containing protein [Terracidiphilus sp.]
MAGLERARAQGRIGGRPRAADNPKTYEGVHKLREQGKTIRQIAQKLHLSSNTVLRVLNAA